MRPSEIMMLSIGFVVALAGLVMGFAVYIDHTGGYFWFYWIAPLLTIGLGAILIWLSVGYWMKVGRLETKGRPRSD
ncbi:MAG: hypothetical protein ACLPVY_06120 [Acidimicrobiia bacterium]